VRLASPCPTAQAAACSIRAVRTCCGCLCLIYAFVIPKHTIWSVSFNGEFVICADRRGHCSDRHNGKESRQAAQRSPLGRSRLGGLSRPVGRPVDLRLAAPTAAAPGGGGRGGRTCRAAGDAARTTCCGRAAGGGGSRAGAPAAARAGARTRAAAAGRGRTAARAATAAA